MGVDIWTAAPSQSPTLSALPALVSRPTITIFAGSRYPPHMGSSRARRAEDVGCGRKSVEMHGANAETKVRWVETSTIDPICGVLLEDSFRDLVRVLF